MDPEKVAKELDEAQQAFAHAAGELVDALVEVLPAMAFPDRAKVEVALEGSDVLPALRRWRAASNDFLKAVRAAGKEK